jgi:FAD-dependent urate hydroxylase
MALSSSASPEVVVIGAGPYGLSIAAHLRHRGIAFRIFGSPMQNWRSSMLIGMFLKSDGAGSNFSDPANKLTLARHCELTAQPYTDHGMPIPLATFVNYGLSFQRALVPDVEECAVASVSERFGTFQLRLETGENVMTRRVVVAVGTTYFRHLPDALKNLPRELISHSRDHADLSKFAHRDVVVIGGGQSALETAALLKEHNVNVRVLVRGDFVRWNPAPSTQTVLGKLSNPRSALGLGWKAWFYCHGPGAFRYLPEKFRSRVVRRALGPAGAWWLKDRIVGNLPILCRHVVLSARQTGGQICLSIAAARNSQRREIFADHVIAATGYRVDVGECPFLDAALKQQLQRKVPVLTANFESSVRGLYFVGLAAADQFGPSMRFVAGADYTARRIAGAVGPRDRTVVLARRFECPRTAPHE